MKLPRPLLHKNLASFIPYIVVILVLIILPHFISSYLVFFLTKILIFAISAMGLNLILGYAGLPSLGHAAFSGVAVYVVAFLTVHYGIESFWLVAPAGVLAALVIAALIGRFIVHLSGPYFLLITLALSQLLFSIAWKWRAITGGDDGLPGIPQPDLGLPLPMGDSTYFYYFVFIIFVACFLLLYRLIGSPFGHAIIGIRENESRMKLLGYNTWRYKYVSFIIGGGLGGVAGVLYAYLVRLASPGDLGIATSIAVLFMVILGSPGTLIGPFIGSILLTTAEYVASSYTPDRWPLILGATFVIVAMYLRGGVGIYLTRYWKKVESWYGSPKN